jgi:hypothetical protein
MLPGMDTTLRAATTIPHLRTSFGTDSFATDSIHPIQNSVSPVAMDAMNVPGMFNNYALQSTRH